MEQLGFPQEKLDIDEERGMSGIPGCNPIQDKHRIMNVWTDLTTDHSDNNESESYRIMQLTTLLVLCLYKE